MVDLLLLMVTPIALDAQQTYAKNLAPKMFPIELPMMPMLVDILCTKMETGFREVGLELTEMKVLSKL
jgi:hypothetical protein